MKGFILMWGATLLFPVVVYAQTTLTGANAAARIVVKTEPLRNNTIDVHLNGQRIASMEGNQTYTGVFPPGKMRITVPGDKPESSVEFEAEANKEYLFWVALVPSTSGGFLFGIVGSSAMATYAIALKETKNITINSAPPVGAANPTPMGAPSAPIVDYVGEAKKSARILGCPTEDVKVVGADNSNVLVTAMCVDGKALPLTCDSTGICLKR